MKRGAGLYVEWLERSCRVSSIILLVLIVSSFGLAHREFIRSNMFVGLSHETQLAQPLDQLSLRVQSASGNSDVSNSQWMGSQNPASVFKPFAKLMASGRLSPGAIVLALAAAAILGAFHALQPGHGKMVIVSHLMGCKSTTREATLLGLTITAAHTGGVYPIGLVALYASCYVFPVRVYPWLGIASGLAIFCMGCFSFMQRYFQRAPAYLVQYSPCNIPPVAGFDQAFSTYQYYGDSVIYTCSRGPEADQDRDGTKSSFRETLALGVISGIVPCPAALVILLSAIAAGRVAYGLLLVLAFSIGIATVLIATGVAATYSRELAITFAGGNGYLMRWLPLTSAGVMALTGMVIILTVLASGGISSM